MTLNAKKKQLVVALEAVAGTTPTSALTTAANANILLLSAEPTLDAEQIDKDYLRTSLTKLKQQTGQKAGGVAATFELSGTMAGTFAGGKPTWSRLLEISGFRAYSLNRIAPGAITGGPFRKGEEVSVGANETGIVAIDCHNGEGELYYVSPGSAALPATGTLTGGDTGATCTLTAIPEPNIGWAWIPVSEVVKSFVATASVTTVVGDVYTGSAGGVFVISEVTTSGTTIIFRPGSDGAIGVGEVFTRQSGTGATTITAHASAPAEAFVEWPSGSIRLNEDGVSVDFVGSRSTASFEFTVNRPVKVTCTTRGLWSAVTDTPFIAGASADIVDAPLWAGIAAGLALNEDADWTDVADEVSPCLKALTLDMGVQLADRQCSGSVDGLQEILGTGRDATGSLTTDANFEAFFPWLGKLRDGEVVRLRVTVGSANGNKFIFHMPGIQSTGVSSGDQDGILTRDVSLSLTGGVNDNLNAGSPDGNIATAGADNEVVLMYITSDAV